MPTSLDKKFWSRLFLVAALFNYVIGFPVLLAIRWSYDVTYMSDVTRDPMVLRLWADFGYQIIARDVTQNRGIALLGIVAKLFDVVNLTTLYAWDIARPLVLVPATIDVEEVLPTQIVTETDEGQHAERLRQVLPADLVIDGQRQIVVQLEKPGRGSGLASTSRCRGAC